MVTEQDGRSPKSARTSRRGRTLINDYQIKDLHTNQAVEIVRGATLVGDVTAPEVHVHGLLVGTVIAYETAVSATGQIWGDIYTARLTLKEGGKIQGWTGSFAADQYDQVAKSARAPTLPDPEIKAEATIESSQQLPALQLLQQETAVALAARAELEKSFEQRLSEIAGKISARNTELKSALETAENQLKAAAPQYDQLQSALADRERQIVQLTGEIEIARELINNRDNELAEFEQTKAAKETVETELAETKTEYKALQERHANLETALQASLAHTADLEESLLRWQELAEFSEMRIQEMEAEQKNLQETNEKQEQLLQQLKKITGEQIRKLQNQVENLQQNTGS